MRRCPVPPSASAAFLLVVALGCGVEPDCPAANLGPLAVTPDYAVVSSEYFTSAVGLLVEGGDLLTEAWIDSGIITPRIAAGLSGDVTLPTTPEPGVLTLVDRLGVDVITRIAIPTGEVLGQVLVSPAPAEGRPAFRANPQDVLALGDGRLLVSRHEPNLDGAAPEEDRGNDLVVIDAATGAITERIDLSPYDVPGDPVRLARPARIAVAGGVAVVGLALLSLDFCRSPCEPAPGGALVVGLGPRLAPLALISLPDLENCGVVRAVPATAARVIVQCQGVPFGTEADRRAGAGFALVSLEDPAAPVVEELFRAQEHPEVPVPSSGLVPLGGSRLFAVAPGQLETGAVDRGLTLDLGSATHEVLFEAAAFTIGQGTFDEVRGLLLVPDTGSGIRRLHVPAGGPPEEIEPVDPAPCRRLPAREIGHLTAG